MKIINHNTGDIEVKRFYVPFVIESDCPHCGELNKFGEDDNDYLMYPKIGEKEKVSFCCTECDASWEEEILLSVTASDPKDKDTPEGGEPVGEPTEKSPFIRSLLLCIGVGNERYSIGNRVYKDGSTEDYDLITEIIELEEPIPTFGLLSHGRLLKKVTSNNVEVAYS